MLVQPDCRAYLLFMSILLSSVILPTWATVDITMAEFLYVANHISQADCRKLVAALHEESFELDSQIVQVGLVLPDTTPCIELLVHWNSIPGEGRGKTHEVLSHRLRQLGHQELATWLSKTVSHQLAKHLEQLELKTVCSYAEQSTLEEVGTTTEVLEDFGEEIAIKQWSPFDSIWLTIIVVLSLAVSTILLNCVFKFVLSKLSSKSREHKYDALIQV